MQNYKCLIIQGHIKKDETVTDLRLFQLKCIFDSQYLRWQDSFEISIHSFIFGRYYQLHCSCGLHAIKKHLILRSSASHLGKTTSWLFTDREGIEFGTTERGLFRKRNNFAFFVCAEIIILFYNLITLEISLSNGFAKVAFAKHSQQFLP